MLAKGAGMFGWFKGLRQNPPVKRDPEKDIDAALDACERFGFLMDRHPLSILDTKALPLPKPEMKVAIKIGRQIANTERLRKASELAYLHLANFQDGVGYAPIDPTLRSNTSPEEDMVVLEPYLARSEQMAAERDVLAAELKEFKARMAAKNK